jgi:hypothetical protein
LNDKGRHFVAALQSADKSLVLFLCSEMKRGQQIVNLLLFSVELLAPKTKAKPSGLPDSNVIFFVATKQTKQKKTWRCAWHVLLDAFWWQISAVKTFGSLPIPR